VQHTALRLYERVDTHFPRDVVRDRRSDSCGYHDPGKECEAPLSQSGDSTLDGFHLAAPYVVQQ
jgi:hypothetical protein